MKHVNISINDNQLFRFSHVSCLFRTLDPNHSLKISKSPPLHLSPDVGKMSMGKSRALPPPHRLWDLKKFRDLVLYSDYELKQLIITCKENVGNIKEYYMENMKEYMENMKEYGEI